MSNKKILRKILNQITTTDIRLKLRFLKNKTGINFYPEIFHKKGLKSLYTRIIFFLLVLEKFYKETRIKYRKIFKTNFNYVDLKFINSLPRSGTTLLQNIILSERELSNSSGDGIPKYISSSDNFIYNDLENKKKIPLNLFEVCYDNPSMYEIRYYNKKVQTYDYSTFYFSHYPISKNDLILDQEKLKQVYLIREPISSSISNLKHVLNFDKFASLKNLNFEKEYIEKKLESICANYKFYLKHVLNQKNNQNIMIIKFENLINSTNETIQRIYNFFNINYDLEILNKAIGIHTKDKTIKRLYKNKSVSNRISNYILEEDLEVLLKKKIEGILQEEIVKYSGLK